MTALGTLIPKVAHDNKEFVNNLGIGPKYVSCLFS